MKKRLAIVCAAGMAASMLLTANVLADEIKVWVADAVVDFTNKQIEAFKEANPDFADFDYLVEAVGE